MCERRPRYVAQLYRDGTEQRGGDAECDGERRAAKHAAASADTWLIAPTPRGDQYADERQQQDRREIPVRDLDDEVGTIERREPRAVTLGPVVAAAHAGAGDADDRAEHEMRAGDEERDVRIAAQRAHWPCTARHVK
jgi:hypothetical protein